VDAGVNGGQGDVVLGNVGLGNVGLGGAALEEQGEKGTGTLREDAGN